MKYTKQELCLIWLDSFLGLEYKHKKELYNYIDGKSDIKSLVLSMRDYIVCAVGENEFNTIYSSANQTYLDYVLDELDKKDIVAITIYSKDYPETLKQISHPPLVLYAKGDVRLLKEKSFSVVGSRKSLPLSIKLAESYCETFVKAGFILVTGVAEGIDSTVLQTALNNKGKMISVIAGGFDNIYPKSNCELLEKVIKDGLAISEYPPSTVSKPYHFPIRNRIIAALSVGTLIVSGGIKSGTLYTAEYALDYGKDLFAIPYSVGIASGAGCNELIKRGAILTDTPKDVLDYYGIEEKTEQTVLTSEEKEIVNILRDGEKHIEKISAQLSKRAFEITPLLSILELKGVVVKSGNVYGLITSNSEE